MPAQPRADSGGHSEKTNFITGQFKPHPTDAVTRKSRPIGATREAARCSSAVALEGISAARARFPDARAAPMIGGSLVGHGHPPGSSRRSVPAKTAGAILAGMRPNIALTPPLNRCPLLAQSGHHDPLNQCPLLGVKRTYKSGRGRRLGGGKLQQQRSVRSVRFSLTRAVKGHMNSPWTVRTTPAVSVHVRVAFRRGRGICGCIELICYQITKAPAGSGGGLVLSGLR